MNETQLIVTVMIAMFFIMAITFSFSNYLANQDKAARKILDDYLLTEKDNPTNYQDDQAKYSPPAEKIEKSGVKAIEIAERTYTFGVEGQSLNCPGISLSPTCSDASAEAPVGFLLTPVGCDLKYGENGQEGRVDAVVLLNGYDSLQIRHPIRYENEKNYGVAWDLNTLAGEESAQDQSAIVVRAVDLQTNCVLAIIQLSFGVNDEGKYHLADVTDPTITDEETVSAVAKELNRMISLDLCNEKLQRYVPVKIGGDFLTQEMRNRFFVQEVETPYEDHYISAVSQQEEHRSQLEEAGPLYAVTVNFGGNSSFITMYMVKKTDSDGQAYAETVGYWRARPT